MADASKHRFVSNNDTNHSHLSATGPAPVRSLFLPHYLSSRPSAGPSTHYDYLSEGDYLPRSRPAFAPAYEFCVPLLPKAAGIATDFQANAARTPVIVAPTASLSCQDQTRARESNYETRRATATVSVPVSFLVNTPVVVPIIHDFNSALRPDSVIPKSPSATSPLEDDAPTLGNPTMSLQDLCQVRSSSLDKPAISPPIVACDSNSSSAPYPLPLDDSAYSECPSVDFSAPVLSPPSSVPSLSYSSFSGSEDKLSSPMSSPRLSVSDLLRLSLTPPLFPVETCDDLYAAPAPGIYADINMRERGWDTRTPPLCVNPADVMSDSLRPPTPTSEWSSPEPESRDASPPANSLSDVTESRPTRGDLSPEPDYTAEFPDEALVNQGFPDEAISAIVSVLKSSTAKYNAPNQHADAAFPPGSFTLDPCKVVSPQPMYAQSGRVYAGNDLGILHPPLGTAAAPGPGAPVPSSGPNKRMPLAEIHLPQPQYAGPTYTTEYPHVASGYPAVDTYSFPPPPPVPTMEPASPVLNAHAGISLQDLRRRAEDFRQRHNGAELDKDFLQCFAGRLSARGELMNEYRCYVLGCEQRNKRRDHILVHVGSHVEHRPWVCRHWYVSRSCS